jgi:hypothetical protein
MANPTIQEKLASLADTQVTVHDPNQPSAIVGLLTVTATKFSLPGYVWRIQDVEGVSPRSSFITLGIKTKAQKA